MKKILFTSILSLAVAVASTESRASENLEVALIENSRTLRLEINSPILETVNLRLYNENDRVIFSERVELADSYESQLDFTDLRNGNYTLVSEVANMRVNKLIKVSETSVQLQDSYYSFIPVFKQENDKLSVYYVNNGGADIGISIENEYDVLSDFYFNDGVKVFNKTFSLAKLSAGNYMIRFVSKGQFHTHEFQVD